MNKIFLLFVFLILSFNSSISADELKCKKFDFKCKIKKLMEETGEYQKKGLGKSKEQIKKNKEQIKDLNPLKK